MQETRRLVLYEDTFTTSRGKHRQSSVRRSCLKFVDFLRKQGYERIPLAQAQDLFSHYLDKWDRMTISSYFGARPGRSTKVIDCTTHYATGTVSQKIIRVRQRVVEKTGYLQKLGLVSFEKVGPEFEPKWFMVINDEAVVCPEIARMSVPTSEQQAQSPCLNLSLSLFQSRNYIDGGFQQLSSECVDDREPTTHTPTIEREIKSLEPDLSSYSRESTLPKMQWSKEKPVFNPNLWEPGRFQEEPRLSDQTILQTAVASTVCMSLLRKKSLPLASFDPVE